MPWRKQTSLASDFMYFSNIVDKILYTHNAHKHISIILYYIKVKCTKSTTVLTLTFLRSFTRSKVVHNIRNNNQCHCVVCAHFFFSLLITLMIKLKVIRDDFFNWLVLFFVVSFRFNYCHQIYWFTDFCLSLSVSLSLFLALLLFPSCCSIRVFLFSVSLKNFHVIAFCQKAK